MKKADFKHSEKLSKKSKQLIFSVAQLWFHGDKGAAYAALVKKGRI